MQKVAHVVIFFFLILGTSHTAFTATTTIDFEGLADSIPVTTQYANLGVTFSGATSLTCGVSLNCPAFPPFSGRNVIYDWPASFAGVLTATFDPTIAGNVHKVSGRVTGNRNVTLTAFDASGNLLDSDQTGGRNSLPIGPPQLTPDR